MSNDIKKLKETFYWLDHEKYDNSLKALDLYEWCDLIVKRMEMLYLVQQETFSEYITSCVAAIKDNSILNIESDSKNPELHYDSPVELLDYFDLGAEFLSHPIPLMKKKTNNKDFLSATLFIDEYREWVNSQIECPTFWDYIDEQQRFHCEDYGTAFLKIDLLATDKTIMESLMQALVVMREKSKFKPYKKNITQADIDRFIRLRIVQYVDIKIFCYFYKYPLPSYNQLSKLLYPEEIYSDVDITDRVRRTTKPTADEVFSDDFLLSFSSQLEITRRKEQ